MDIPNHPLRVKGLQYLQSKDSESKQRTNDTHMEVCTCPKCGNQMHLWSCLFCFSIICLLTFETI